MFYMPKRRIKIGLLLYFQAVFYRLVSKMSETEKSVYRLVLHPQNADYAPESSETIQKILFETGFIAESHSVLDSRSADVGQSFLVGEQFLQLLTFMGCSPSINLTPQHDADRDYCHIVLSPIYAHVHFRSHERDVFARCPECGRRDANWPALIERWYRDRSRIGYVCHQCHKSTSLYDLRWRQVAGFGRFFIDVFSIFPQEGIPSNHLLSALEDACAQPWTYFFTNC